MSTTTSPTPRPTLYLNLPTTSLPTATTFFTSLGFTLVPAWTDSKSSALLLPEPNQSICLLVHTHERFNLCLRPNSAVVDARTSTETIFSIMCDTKEDVDRWLEAAEKAGGKKDPYVLEEFGAGFGLYLRSWEDVDGHIWETAAMLGKVWGWPEEGV